MPDQQVINLIVQAGIGVIALFILYQFVQYMKEQGRDNNKLLSALVAALGEGNAQTNLLRQAVEKNSDLDRGLVTSFESLRAFVEAAPGKALSALKGDVVDKLSAEHDAIRSGLKTADEKLDQAKAGIDNLQALPGDLKILTDEVRQLHADLKIFVKVSESVEQTVIGQGKLLSDRFGAVEQKLSDVLNKLPTPVISMASIAPPEVTPQ